MESPLALKTSREIVRGKRGATHIAHPLADKTLCGVAIGERPGIDAYGRHGVDGYGTWPHEPRPFGNDCEACERVMYAGQGNEERQMGAYC